MKHHSGISGRSAQHNAVGGRPTVQGPPMSGAATGGISFTESMTASDDYHSLTQGLSSLDFSGDHVPCKLLLSGDTAFPVLVSPSQDVLIGAGSYGMGRVVVLGHELYFSQPQFIDFLKNAISWLMPSSRTVIGVTASVSSLEETLSSIGYQVEKNASPKEDLAVLCTSGYDDSEANEIVSFVRRGGGLLIGAQAYQWAADHKQDNVLCNFPGNKITSVAGIYFTDMYGERGNFCVSKNMQWCPFYKELNFSADLKQLMEGVQNLDLTGGGLLSELLLHGPLTFPVGLTKNNQCFIGAGYYGKGRVFVGTHEGMLLRPEFKTLILNAISWLGKGKKGTIGVNSNYRDLVPVLQNGGFTCEISQLLSKHSVYCCTSYSDKEANKINRFVAEGGGLFIAGHAWYWSYSNPNVHSEYPGNKILNKFGITILSTTVEAGVYKGLDPQATANTYHFPRAISQLLCDLQGGANLKAPLDSWLSQLTQDTIQFMKVPESPLISLLLHELVSVVGGYKLPEVSKMCPVKNGSKDAFLICLAQDLSSFAKLDDQELKNLLDQPAVTVQIDATNTGDDAWRSTGLYLPPRKTAILLFPDSVLGKGLQVQVGCHTDNLSSRNELCRAPVVVLKKSVTDQRVVVSSVWGGLLYIIVKGNSNLGMISVSVHGAELAPTYIKGQTSNSSWVQTIRKYPAPWAELITDNIILTVPSEVIRSLDDPDDLMTQWDDVMVAVADLAAIPKKFARPERIVADVQLSLGWMHSGYPIMCHLQRAKDMIDLQQIKKSGLWGYVHELGHNQQKSNWEFPPHTTEATNNLWSVYVHETVLNISRDRAHPDLKPADRTARLTKYIKDGAKLQDWSMWTALETYLRLQEAFGWDPFKHLFSEYQTLSNVNNNNKDKMNLWAEKFSQAVHKNLAPYFQAWGWPIEEKIIANVSTLPEWEENPMKSYVASK
ncbi:TRPM8 channel-associated factor homolog isoform X2 [Pseudophryne corroboree]|uniref:TRPM8 channel-associated factor homolog isoform X2 n=1 Tax=Pseudophryne corroboree TaxID=495146 RepID=UPI0030815D36